MKHITLTLSLIAAAFLSANAQSSKPVNAKQVQLSNKGFYQNKGQITDQNYKPNPAVKYLLCSPGFNVQLRQTGFSYDTYTDSVDSNQSSVVGGQFSDSDSDKALPMRPSRQPAGKDGTGFIRHYHRVDIELVGCNPNAQMLAEGQSTTYYNYFTAGTPKGGVSNVHTYQKVTYKNIYPNIDLVFMAKESDAASKQEQGNSHAVPPSHAELVSASVPVSASHIAGVEYNFIVHPGGKVSDIKLQYKGENSISLKNNQLVVNVNAGDFSESIPNSYIQENKQPVAVNYRVIPFPPAGGQGKAGAVYGFSINHSTFNINHSTLIIDPTPNLAWGTYYGGAGRDDGVESIALDASNNVYTAGSTSSTASIATVGAYQTTYADSTDAFVAKFSSTGTVLLWGTYYGGTGEEDCEGMALDASDNVYITGTTSSTSGIATVGAYQTVYGGGTADAFIAKFNSSGSTLLWGTYYGGTGYEFSYGGITLDASDNVYITGQTTSTTGIATVGAYQTLYGGGGDTYVAKFNSSGSSLLWGTYYGGNNQDYGGSITLDAANNVYILKEHGFARD